MKHDRVKSVCLKGLFTVKRPDAALKNNPRFTRTYEAVTKIRLIFSRELAIKVISVIYFAFIKEVIIHPEV